MQVLRANEQLSRTRRQSQMVSLLPSSSRLVGDQKTDILRVFNAFFAVDHRQFRCVNGALLILMPKTQDPKAPKDYRPISLIHNFPKLTPKILANRLAPRLNEMIGCDQTAFIRGRSFLDSFKYVQRSAALLKKRRIPSSY